jgi:hypothetical protein
LGIPVGTEVRNRTPHQEEAHALIGTFASPQLLMPAIRFWPVRYLFTMLCLTSVGLVALQCSGEAELTADQKKKLDGRLQRVVLDGTDADLQTTTREDGSVAYHLFVRTDDAEALRDAGLPINSVLGGVVTARWTADEIRAAARQKSVRMIEPAGGGEPLR